MNKFKKAITQRWYNYFKSKGYNDEDINNFLLKGYRKCEYCNKWTNTKKGHHYLHLDCIKNFYDNRLKDKRRKLLKISNDEKDLLLNNQCQCSVCGKIFNLDKNLIKCNRNRYFICSQECMNKYHKQGSPLSKEYWLKRGYTEENAKNEISKIQKERGDVNALKLKERPFDKSKCPLCKEYYIKKGKSEEEAIKLKDEYIKYINSKEHLIEKYGEDKGISIYNKILQYQKQNYSKEYYIKKYGEEEGLIIWAKQYQYSQGTSKIANNLFSELYKRLGIDVQVYSKSISKKEFGKYINDKMYVFYDFVIPELKICIEYNGDYWHCNPTKYKADYYHKQRKLYAKEIWELDEIKKKKMVNEGYDYFVIWDSDIGRRKQRLDEVLNKYSNIIIEKWRLNNVKNEKNC